MRERVIYKGMPQAISQIIFRKFAIHKGVTQYKMPKGKTKNKQNRQTNQKKHVNQGTLPAMYHLKWKER